MSYACVDLDAIAANVRQLRRLLPPGTRFGAVVKADGYGHGAVPVATAALSAGADWLMVATVAEGDALRAAGITGRILVLSPTDLTESDALVRGDLTPMIATQAQAEALAAAAVSARLPPPHVHVKVDTGLGRYGVAAADAAAFVRSLHDLRGVRVEGIATHYATADDPDDPYLSIQNDRFAAVIAALERAGVRPPLAHAANSGAVLQGVAPWDLVRVGIALYGIPPGPHTPLPVPLTAALRVESRIAQLCTIPAGGSVGYGRSFIASEPTRAALIPLGYADGLPRSLSNRGGVLIGRRWCRLIGRVSMDQCVAALPPGLDAAIGDPVIVVGAVDGAEQTINAVAEAADTIGYELAVRFGARLGRRYIGAVPIRDCDGIPAFVR